ncbi:MAG: hypothetical protein H7Z37_01525 [Pyrinomonadaceae bacterium]|nr:hypothetical protein [Pyrinomonadaceae bacterium]
MSLWLFLPFGYLLTILIETPVLVVGLSRKISLRQKLFCGAWLTACTYPIVVLVLPTLLAEFSRGFYLIIAETFAPVAECLLFWMIYGENFRDDKRGLLRSLLAITLANLLSFAVGEIIGASGFYQLFS